MRHFVATFSSAAQEQIVASVILPTDFSILSQFRSWLLSTFSLPQYSRLQKDTIMSSRKKKQGKKKKSGKVSRREEWLPGIFPGVWKQDCNHGCTLPSDADTDCTRFFKVFLQELYRDHRNAEDSLATARKRYPKALEDPASLEKVKGLFLKFGVDFALSLERPAKAGDILIALILLEDPSTPNLSEGAEYRLMQLDDIDGKHDYTSMDLEVVRELSKQISCSCLDAKKAQAKLKKKQTTTGKCGQCKQQFGLTSLMVCSKCKITNYCSKECQVADWPAHKFICQVVCPLDDTS